MTGRIDESLRIFSEREKRIARLLASEGASVRSLPCSSEEGERSADAEVDGVTTEFKWLRGARDVTVKHALNRARGQARHVVIDAMGSGLQAEDALRGVRRFVATGSRQLKSVRLELDSCTMTVTGLEGGLQTLDVRAGGAM